jgi:hypothetical protein
MRTAVVRGIGTLFIACTLQAASADSAIVTTADFVAIRGYDAVAYFTDGKAVKGSPSYEFLFDDAKWRFATAQHKEMFTADPDRYMPQYGALCANSMVRGESVPADPELWAIVDGRLYMIAGDQGDVADWKAHTAANIKAADEQWAKLQGQ